MQLSCSFPPGPRVVEYAKLAEQLGYARVWLYDSPLLFPDVWMTRGPGGNEHESCIRRNSVSTRA